jgi:signal transduction histidine kinase
MSVKTLKRFLRGFKGLIFVFFVLAGLVLYMHTQTLVRQLRDESRSIVQFFAQWYALAAEEDDPELLSFIFDQIISKTNFPLIITDVDRNPTGWKGIGIDREDGSPQSITRVRQIVERLDRGIEPVVLRYEEQVLGYLYYGDSAMIQQLRWLPTIEMGVMALFILLGFVGYSNIMRSEQRYIWVGMAKETAHQLGTPISSLMGWLEVMKSGKRSQRPDLLKEMEKDLQRLKRVSERFSQIGSSADLKKTDIREILHEVAEYIRRRAPQMGRRVTIVEVLDDTGSASLNGDLFQWAVENILKNALDAMDKAEGRVEIRLFESRDGSRVVVEVEDNGKGMDKAQKKRIFKPGYSTKSRGWGLGLTLARRIVEEYHGGKLFLKETRPGLGSTMRIELHP